MLFEVDERIFDRFPHAQVGILVVDNLDNQTGSSQARYILSEAVKDTGQRIQGDALLDLGELTAWREAYKWFGAPKRQRSSIESLLKRVQKGQDIPSINPLVDIYNAVSLRHHLPCGGEDIHHIHGPMRLTLADGDESFQTIGSDVDQPPNPGEVVYKDDRGCICRCWNWREADRTKLTGETTSAILFVEVLQGDQSGVLGEALDHLDQLTTHLLGGTTKRFIASKDNPTWQIER